MVIIQCWIWGLLKNHRIVFCFLKSLCNNFILVPPSSILNNRPIIEKYSSQIHIIIYYSVSCSSWTIRHMSKIKLVSKSLDNRLSLYKYTILKFFFFASVRSGPGPTTKTSGFLQGRPRADLFFQFLKIVYLYNESLLSKLCETSLIFDIGRIVHELQDTL